MSKTSSKDAELSIANFNRDDLADALEFDGAEAWDKKSERWALLKVDLLLMPILTFSYGLQFYDKFVFSSAAVFGMLADLKLETPIPGTHPVQYSTHRYSTATAAFYWGYIIGVLPIALALQRAPLAKALSLLIFLWGVIVILTVTVTNFHGAVAQRFFLGMVESAVSPGFVLLSTMWYTKDELPLRLGIWYSATGLFTIFSGVVNYGIGHAHGALAPWKYMYLLAGALTILWSLVLLALLPDSPASPRARAFFTPRERAILARRLRGSVRGADVRRVRWGQVREALIDWKVWLMGAMGAAIYVCNGGVTAFGSLIIKSFGYSPLQAILMQTPGGATTCVSIYLSTLLLLPSASALLRRLLHLPPSSSPKPLPLHHLLLILTALFPLAGALVVWLAPWSPRGVPLFGYYLIPIFGAPYVILLALASKNVGGGTKKAVATGAVFVGYNVGNIVGPYLVNTSEAPHKYRTTWVAIVVVMGFTIVAAALMGVLLARENARRDRLAAVAAAAERQTGGQEEATPRTPPESDEKSQSDENARPQTPGDEKHAHLHEADAPGGTAAPEPEGLLHVDLDLTDWEDASFRYTL